MATNTRTKGLAARWLIPGQQFRVEDASATSGQSVMTVTRIVNDPLGLNRAVLRDGDGREVITYVDQIRFAIEAGMMSPLGSGASGVDDQDRLRA